MATSPSTLAGAPPEERSEAINDVRLALAELLGAERRLRARDQQRRDKMTYAQSPGAAARPPATAPAMRVLPEGEGVGPRRRSRADGGCVRAALPPGGRAFLDRKRAEGGPRGDGVLAAADAADRETAAAVIRR